MEVFRLLGETARDTWRPIAALDGEVQDYQEQIAHHLRTRGMLAHAALLAKSNRLPDRLQWFTDLPGPVISAAALPPHEQQQIVDHVLLLLEEIRREGLRLGGERNPASRTLSDLISAALTGADSLRVSDVHLAGGQPVIAWGIRPVAGALPTIGLFGRGSAPLLLAKPVAPSGEAAPPSAAAAVPPSWPSPPIRSGQSPGLLPLPAPVTQVIVHETRRWVAVRWPVRLLGAAAALLTLAALLVWLLPEPALAPRAAPFCALPPDAGQTEESTLRGQVAQLERDLAGRIRQCTQAAAVPAPAPVLTPTPTPHLPTREDVGGRLQREHARAGHMQVTLAWNGRADLDLYVQCPNGEAIGRNASDCGGMHDVDMNFPPEGHMSDTPVEHVVWPNGAPSGKYSVIVDYYGATELSSPVPFVVTIDIGGQTTEFHGTAEFRQGRMVVVTTFMVP